MKDWRLRELAAQAPQFCGQRAEVGERGEVLAHGDKGFDVGVPSATAEAESV